MYIHVIVSTVPESVIEVEPYVLPHEESCPVSLLHSAWTENETISTIYTNIHYVHVHSETQAYNINNITIIHVHCASVRVYHYVYFGMTYPEFLKG